METSSTNSFNMALLAYSDDNPYAYSRGDSQWTEAPSFSTQDDWVMAFASGSDHSNHIDTPDGPVSRYTPSGSGEDELKTHLDSQNSTVSQQSSQEFLFNQATINPAMLILGPPGFCSQDQGFSQSTSTGSGINIAQDASQPNGVGMPEDQEELGFQLRGTKGADVAGRLGTNTCRTDCLIERSDRITPPRSHPVSIARAMGAIDQLRSFPKAANINRRPHSPPT